MTRAVFTTCSGCGRYMLGQLVGGVVYPQPHQCEPGEEEP